jgi:hypothetical protein
MLHTRKAEPPRRMPAAIALDPGATIQDALVRRLRLTGLPSTDAKPHPVLEDRAPIAAVVGRRR